MRIFTGVKLADGVRDKIVKELKSFKKAGTSIRWTESGNFHLTLKFIGEADEDMTAHIAAALAAARIPIAPFCLRVAGFGKFPASESLHVFWAGVEDHPSLSALFALIEAALLPLGIEREARPFQPHLTLGRNRVRYNFKTFFALLAEKRDLFLAEWQVPSFQLFASRLTPVGPVHKVLKEFALVQS